MTADLAQLFEQYYASLVRMLYRRVGDRDRAEDLAQETFARAVAAPPNNPRPWLFAVALNLVREDRVVIEGVNIIVKHIKRGRARQAGRVEMEGPLHMSNVMLICPSCKKPTRVGVQQDASGKNERFCKKCETAIPRGEL